MIHNGQVECAPDELTTGFGKYAGLDDNYGRGTIGDAHPQRKNCRRKHNNRAKACLLG
jgi:hypothetical protein